MNMVVAISMMAAAPQNGTCGLLFPVVPNHETARRVAEAVIQADPEAITREAYSLRVEPDPSKGRWIAYQTPIQDPDLRTFGGYGLAMYIDRCTGQVSRLYRQR